MFQKAHKSLSKARICIAGPAGSGKTYTSLLIGSGLGNRIAMIDTERGSGVLYSDLLDYDILQLCPPIVFDLSNEHIATSTKDRTSLFDGQFFMPGKETGQKILSWLKQGSNSQLDPVLTKQESNSQKDMKELVKFVDESFPGTKKIRPVSVFKE